MACQRHQPTTKRSGLPIRTVLLRPFWLGRAQIAALVPVPAPVPAAAATTAPSSGEAAFAVIEALRTTYAAAFSAPASTGGSRPEQLSTALFLSNVVKNINQKPAEADIVEFLNNIYKVNINTFAALVHATEITEQLPL